MVDCKKIRGRKRDVCLGAMRDQVELDTREIKPPSLGGVDFTELFTPIETVSAYIETVRGKTIFDESNTERDVTHKIYIRFVPFITAQTWLKFDSKFYDILDVENLEERNDFLLLRCAVRGSDTVATNFA